MIIAIITIFIKIKMIMITMKNGDVGDELKNEHAGRLTRQEQNSLCRLTTRAPGTKT